MNKKLIALAVAGACIAPEAIAQTANPVTLYGRAYATFESIEADAGAVPTVNPALTRRNRVSDQSSYLGVRGTEDLGGGLKAFFQLETGFKLDQNDTTFAARNSGVGLQGGWGSIILGRWDTPFKSALGAIDPWGDLTLGGIQAGMMGGGVNNVATTTQGDRRDQNVVQYWSPSWAGIAVRLSYSANEARSSTPCAGRPAGQSCNPLSQGGSISYTGGPVYIAYAYHELKDQPMNSLQLTVNTTGAITAIAFPVITPPKQTFNLLAGSFTFGPIKFGAAYEKVKRGSSGLAPGPLVVTGFSDRKAYTGNIVWTFGNHQLIYSYQRGQDGGVRVQGTPTVAINVTEPKCTVNTPGYQYNFSRRTFFNAQYTKIDNNATGTCNFGANQQTIGLGQDLKGISLGLRHVF